MLRGGVGGAHLGDEEGAPLLALLGGGLLEGGDHAGARHQVHRHDVRPIADPERTAPVLLLRHISAPPTNHAHPRKPSAFIRACVRACVRARVPDVGKLAVLEQEEVVLVSELLELLA